MQNYFGSVASTAWLKTWLGSSWFCAWYYDLFLEWQVAVGSSHAFNRPHVLWCIVLNYQGILQFTDDIHHIRPVASDGLNTTWCSLNHPPHRLRMVLSFYTRINNFFNPWFSNIWFCLHQQCMMVRMRIKKFKKIFATVISQQKVFVSGKHKKMNYLLRMVSLSRRLIWRTDAVNNFLFTTK